MRTLAQALAAAGMTAPAFLGDAADPRTLDAVAAYEERAAILEHDARFGRDRAERMAAVEASKWGEE